MSAERLAGRPAETCATLLDGWSVARSATAPAPVAAAAAILASLGARQLITDHSTETMLVANAGDGRRGTAELRGWSDDGALELALYRLVPDSQIAPTGSVLGAYSALRLAGAAIAATTGETDLPVETSDCIDELFAALLVNPQTPRPELIRCEDGWIVVRLRDDDERMLFDVLTGPGAPGSVEQTVAECRIARLLVGPVRPPGHDLCFDLSSGRLDGSAARGDGPVKVVDWTVLWAGPWMTEQLRAGKAQVRRIEHPRRRDGLLGWREGRIWWHEMNGAKEMALLDAHQAADRTRLNGLISAADILVTSMTARGLRSLGFDDDWRRENAPGCLHVELVAYDEPWSDSPGLGEHAAAQAGLSWRPDAERPAAPYPWADPMLGAAALVICRAWLALPERRGGRVRLSLERAASLAFADVG